MSTKRKDLLHQLEIDVQKKWEDLKVFEVDAPAKGDGEKFMCTFPYPYMNGLLHIGHAFSLTKAVFAAHFNRLCGKKVLFPFGFHCTGMPIQAAANKLRREFEVYGSPYPTFPASRPQPKEKDDAIVIDDAGVTLTWKAPCSTGQKAITSFHILRSVDSGDFTEVAVVAAPSADELKAKGRKMEAKAPIESGGSCVYKIDTELADGSLCPTSKESDGITVGAAPKDKKGGGKGTGPRVAKKIAAKSGDAAFQYEILLAMGLSPDDLEPFSDPLHWLMYFPPLGKDDLKRFGTPVDFRRSFITTSVNPYYDSFIRWQFRRLKAGDKIGFGKRPTVFSELDGQACMDHDRAEGEGVGPQEYTAIKIELLEFPAVLKPLEGKRVFLLAATLRPETMPGQTNCWILPSGKYGCFKAPAEGEVYICSHRAARNMSFQDRLTPWARPECLMDVTGKDLMGCKVKAPLTPYEYVHLLPLMTIKMDKGTGVVTSVPSDSPDDYAAFMDLKKPGKLEFHGLKAEWVEPFKIIPIIDVELDGEVQAYAAKYMCEKLNVQSQNDREKLQEAHDVCYKIGFDKGIMSTGAFKGQPVKKAKLEQKAKMVADGEAFNYHEPEKRIVSRSGDDCVIAGIDQWFLRYGQEGWRKQIEDHLTSSDFCTYNDRIKDHLTSSDFCTYNDRIKDSFLDAIGWLKEWACSRSFGLGTKVPWDEQFLIESLSDSTIYMAYYTVAHILQGDINGCQAGQGGFSAEELDDSVWDYVFLNGPMPEKTKIPKATLEKMQREFRFWYPMDLRVSGKDLIQNHLTMSLYNHAAVWDKEPELWPRSFFCNGWLLVNNEKMSKSKGNFFTLADIMNKYSADTVRMALANSGDTLEPANFEEKVAEKALLAFPVYLETMEAVIKGTEPMDEGKEDARFVDRWFANEMNRLVDEAKREYEAMRYREALRFCYYEFSGAFDQYKDICRAAKILPHKGLTMRYYEWQMVILSPICPHFCEHAWGMLGKTGSVLDAKYPIPVSPVDKIVVAMGAYIYDKVPHDFIKLKEKTEKQGKATAATVYVAKCFPDWKVHVLAKLREKHAAGALPLNTPDEMKSDDTAKAQWKDVMAVLMADATLKPVLKHVGPFAAFKRDEAFHNGPSALEASLPFDEMALLSESVAFLKEKLSVEMKVCLAESPEAPEHAVSAGTAQPGQPAVHFIIEGGGGAKGKAGGGGGKAPAGDSKAKAKAAPGGEGDATAKAKAKAASGGDAKAASKAGAGGKKATAAAAFNDLKALDAHLSTRSYMAGGPGPTAGDAAQFAAMPAGSLEDGSCPHAARWHKHITSFTPFTREQWA